MLDFTYFYLSYLKNVINDIFEILGIQQRSVLRSMIWLNRTHGPVQRSQKLLSEPDGTGLQQHYLRGRDF